jgi:hypothetical protein
MDLWTEWQHIHMLPLMSMEPWDVIKKAVTLASVRVPTQRPLVVSFMSVVGLVENF